MMKNLSFPVKQLTLAAMVWIAANQMARAQYTPTQPYKGKIGMTVLTNPCGFADR